MAKSEGSTPEDVALYDEHWGPRFALIKQYQTAMLKMKLAAYSRREAKRVKRCKRNLRIARKGGYASDTIRGWSAVSKAVAG